MAHNLENLAKTLTDIAVYTELLPVFLYLFSTRKFVDRGIQAIIFLLCLGFVTDAYGLHLIKNGQANFLFYNVFNLVETTALLYYFFLLIKFRQAKFYFLITFIVFFIVWSFQFYHTGNSTFNDSAVTLEYSLVICLGILFFYRQINSMDTQVPYQTAHFWIVSAYLLYIAGTFFLFLLINDMTPQEQAEYYVLNYVFLLVKTLMLSVAMLMKPRPEKPKKFQLT